MVQAQDQPYDIPDGTPEFYIDSANIQTQFYGSTLLLGELRQDKPPLINVKIKVSPQMVKVLSLIMSKHVREYERDVGEIVIPKSLLHDLGLEDLI